MRRVFVIGILGVLLLAGTGCGTDREVPVTDNAVDVEMKEETGNTSENPLDWQGQYDLGIRLLGEGKYEEAIIAFTAAIQIDAKKADAYIRLAEAYMGDGQPEEALRVLEGVPENVDQPEAVQKALEDFQEQAENLRLEAMTDQEKIEYYLEKSFDSEHLLLEDPVTLFDQDLRTLTMEQFKGMAESQGWVSRDDMGEQIMFLDDSGIAFSAYSPGGSPFTSLGTAGQLGGNILWTASIGYDNLSDYGRMDEYERQEMESLLGKETGFLDLCFGDSLATVLDRLGIKDAEKLSGIAIGTEEYISVNRQCYRNRESLKIGEVEGGGMYMNCFPEVDGNSSEIVLSVFSYCKTTEDSSGSDEDGNTEVMLYFGGPDMTLYGVSFHNAVAYNAMYGTE